MNNNYNKTEFQKELIGLPNIDFKVKVDNRFSKILSNTNWGFETGSGWNSLLWELFEEIEIVAIPYKIKIIIQQIKEKFGSLRFYYNTDSKDPTPKTALDLIETLVNLYEEKSYNVCDITGRYYKYRIASGSWVYACCYDAFVKRYSTQPQMVERARKDIVARVQFDRIIDTIKQGRKERQFISSLSQTGILNEYLDEISISKLVENEFWLDSDKL
ncbi:MAG: hypothetical protein WC942_09930 [Clostridia bacterium]|jgi:bisphosphoglycerate-independent phosphoglycerate mutase (AlkP superfamily)